MDDKITDYIVRVVDATRHAEANGIGKGIVSFGASPRASLALARASRSLAFLETRGFVIPEDIRIVGPYILRHRIILSFEAEAENTTSDDVIKKIFDSVEVP